MNSDYTNLRSLESNNGYLALQDLWREKFAEIQAKRDRAASRGQESAWRYAAGVEKGFQEAVMTLALYLQSVTSEDETNDANAKIDKMLSEIRGEK
jgi:hypothetical protein